MEAKGTRTSTSATCTLQRKKSSDATCVYKAVLKNPMNELTLAVADLGRGIQVQADYCKRMRCYSRSTSSFGQAKL